MRTDKNMPYYLAAAAVFVLLKFAFAAAGTEDLVFLLAPTDKLTGWLTGSRSVFFSERGFYHGTLNVLIGKSCSGYNFLVLCFLCFYYLAVKYFDKPLYKVLALAVSLTGAYLLTIFVNTSRIFASIVVQNQTKNIFPYHRQLVHETVGIITSLSFLILAYYLTEKFFEYRRRYAQSIQS